MRTWMAIVLLALPAAGCLRETAFHCATDTDCAGAGAGAACEDVGFCSVDDGSCAAGVTRQRYVGRRAVRGRVG